MNKELFDEIINDIISQNHGNTDALIIIYHSNGVKSKSPYKYIVFEDSYLKILKSDENELCQYIPYESISAIYSEIY